MNDLEETEMNEQIEILKKHVFEIWLSGVKGGIGSFVPYSMDILHHVERMGFYGDFTGLDKFYSKYKFAAVLEAAILKNNV